MGVTHVLNLLEALSLDNVYVSPGIFPDETSSQIKSPVVLAHIDVDVYESARSCFEFLEPMLVKGGIIVFDDYVLASTDGVQKYVDELRSNQEMLMIYNQNGHAIFVKQ